MPISSRACPVGEPAVTSLRPSRLAIKVAGATVVLPGTVIPSVVVLAEAAVTPRVPSAAAAARPAPIPRARRRLVVLIMMIVLPETLRPVPRGMASVDFYAGRGPAAQFENVEKLTAMRENQITARHVASHRTPSHTPPLLPGKCRSEHCRLAMEVSWNGPRVGQHERLSCLWCRGGARQLGVSPVVDEFVGLGGGLVSHDWLVPLR